MDAEPGSPHKLNEQPISVDFIDNHAHEYDAAFANLQTRYDQRLGKYQPEAHYDKQVISHSLQYGHYPRPQPAALNELEFWEQIFPLAMDSFKAAHPEEPKGRSESAYSIRRLDNWAAVYKILQDAQTANESPSGIRGSVKKGFRRVMKHTQPLEQILSVVPEIDYISPVTGTLGIIIKAAKRSIQVRDDVANGLNALEQQFGDIDTYLKIFSKDENIVKASVGLVSSTLKAVEDIIGYFLRRSASKVVSALFNAEDYQRALSESLEDIKRSGEDLLNQARISNMWQNQHAAQQSSSILISISQKQQRMADTQNELNNCLGQLLHNIENRCRENDELMKLVKQQATQLASQEAHYHFHVCPTIQQGPSPGLTREDIINLLDTPAFHLNDVEHILEIRELIPNEDRARAERLLNAREFRNWIMAPRSQELLIHGDFTGTRRVSGLSWLCCCLLHALQQTQRFYSLTFFCGCHLDATDPHAGGRGIIRSLLLQLLWRQEYTLRDEGVNWELIQAGDIHHLCFLFELVLRHLSPDSVVFCIIDGIKYYERDQYLPEMYEVLRFLLDLTQGDRLQSVFKLLVASPSPTTEVRHIFNQDGIMTMASLPINADKSSSLRVLRHLENLG